RSAGIAGKRGGPATHRPPGQAPSSGRPGAVVALDHHARRLDPGVDALALVQVELLDGVARDRGRDPVRPGLDLDERHDAVDLDRDDPSREAIARRELVPRLMARGMLAQPLNLL